MKHFGSKSLFGLFAVVFLLGSLHAQAKVPSNCAVTASKLKELVAGARHLPDNMDQHILGHWKGKKLGASVDIRITKTRSGSLMLDLHAVSELLGINQRDKGPVMMCFSNSREIDVYMKLFGKDEHTEVLVKNTRELKILKGKISGTYKKQN